MLRSSLENHQEILQMEACANPGCTLNSNKDAIMFNTLGNAYFDQENFSEAIEAYYHGLEIERAKFEPSHPNIIVTLINISESYRRRGDFELAIEVYFEVFRLQQQRFGRSHPDVSRTLHAIALIYDEMGDLPRALECNTYSLRLQNLCEDGRDLQNLSVTLTHAGCIFYRMNDISSSKNSFGEALELQRKMNSHAEVAFTLYNIGLCHQSTGCYRKAIECYIEALQLEEKVHGRDHRETIPTRFNLGQAYTSLGQYDKALSYFQNALRINRESCTGKEEGPCTEASIMIEMGYVHYFQGNVEKLFKILSEISGISEKNGFNRDSMQLQYLKMFSRSCQSLAPAA